REREEHQRALASEAVAGPTSRILIQPVERVLQRRKQADRDAARAKRRQVLRKVTLPKLFAQSQAEDAQRQHRDVAIQAEIIARGCQPSGLRVHVSIAHDLNALTSSRREPSVLERNGD